MKASKVSLGMEVLEGRTLPSTTNPWGYWGVLSHPDAAVQADLAKINTDGQALFTATTFKAFTKDFATLQADFQQLQIDVQAQLSGTSSISSSSSGSGLSAS